MPIYVRWGSTRALEKVNRPVVEMGNQSVALIPIPLILFSGQINPKVFWTMSFMAYSHTHDALFPLYLTKVVDWGRAYPADDPENRALSEIEDKLLGMALKAKDPKTRNLDIAQFLAVRHTRYKKLGAQMARYERLVEAVDGSTEYTTSLFAESANQPGYRSTSFLERAHFHWEPSGKMLKDLEGFLFNPLDPIAIRHLRFSMTGMAQMALLDRLSYPWKVNLIDGSASLDEMLARAIHYPASKEFSLFTMAKATWGYDRLLARARAEVAKDAGTMKAFTAQQGTRFNIALQPVAPPAPGEQNPAEFLRLDAPNPPTQVDEETMLVNGVGHFDYKKGETRLQLKDTSLMMHSTSQDWPFQQVSFYATAPEIQLDGHPFTLHDGSFPFQQLLVRGSDVMLHVTGGTLTVSGNGVTIEHS